MGALAANLASSSSQDDLSLLTDSFSTLQPVTNGLVNGVLSRLGASTSQSAAEPIVRPSPLERQHGRADLWCFPQTTQQVNSIIAFSQYAIESTPAAGNHQRLLDLLRCAPAWDIESSLGLQGEPALCFLSEPRLTSFQTASQDWSPPDQLSHALVSGLLVLTAAGAGDRSSTLSAVTDYQKALVDEIERAEEGESSALGQGARG